MAAEMICQNREHEPEPTTLLASRYAKYIGRVGALALALGVGMALATTPGVAWATPDADHSSTDSTGAAAKAPDADKTADAGLVSTPPASTVSGPSTTTGTPASTGDAAPTTSPQSPTESTTMKTVGPDSAVRSSGGALPSRQKLRSLLVADPPSLSAPATHNTLPVSPTTKQPAALSATPKDVAVQAPSSPAALAATTNTTLRMTAVNTNQPAAQPNTAPKPALAALAAAAPLPAPANPVAALLAIPATFINATANFLNAAIVSFLSPAPGQVPNSPLLWAALAWTRRQFFNQTPTITAGPPVSDALGNIKITLNQTDADGDALTYTATNGSQGTVTVNPDGHSLTYDPNPGATGTDTFSVTASDASAAPHIHGLPGLLNALSFGVLGDAGHTSTIQVTVVANTPPIANNDTATVLEGNTTTFAVTANDTDAGGIDLSSVTITQPTTHGALTVNNDGTVTYASDGAEVTTDSFKYTVKDTSGAISNEATVTISITPVDDAPVAVDDSEEVFEGGDTQFFVSLNDTDAENNINHQSVTITQAPSHGSATVDPTGSITYVHNGDESPTDTFKYTVKDTDGKVSNVATVTMNVFAVDDAPVAVDDVLTVAEGGSQTISVVTNDTDAEHNLNPASVVISQQAGFGTLTPNGNGSFTYTSNGAEVLSDSFKYTVKDTDGKTSNVATVHITITPVNDPPVKTAEPTASTPSPDEPTVTGQVFARDPDIGDHLRYSATAAKGSVSIDTFGSYTYTPNDAARSAGRTSPTDTVTVTVTDDQGATLTISFQVGIAPFNSAPVKSAESTTTGPTFEHPEVTGHVFATDPDGDHLTYSATVGKGFVDIDDDGVFTYRPGDDARKLAGRPGATGDALKDTVTVAVTDVYGATTMITVPVTVAPAQNAVVDTIMLTNAPSHLFAGPNNTFYVLQGNSVIQINAVTHAVVRTVPLGFSPTDLVITPDGAILASNKGDNSVTKFPAGGGQSQRLDAFLQPTEMVLGSDDKTLYVLNSQVNTVSRADSTNFQSAEPPDQGTSTISPITALAVSFDGRTIFGMLADKRVIVADVSGPGFTFIETGVQTPASVRMLMSPADKLYVIDPTNGAVEVFTKSLLGYSGSDLVGRGAPSDIALSEFGSRVYVVNKLAGDVTVYDGSNNRLVATVPIGGSPDEVDIDPTGRYLYVSDSATKNVSIIRLDIPAAPDED